jgi:hypothetical protein
MGRLVLNVLLSFAQFEREIISERTRDKIAAARRKGKWAGRHPLLGYDVDPRGFRLVVNEDEAVRVRAIFELYLELRAMIPVVEELERRGWRNKRWVTRKDRERGGMPFDKNSLHRLLTNVAYVGKLRYKTEVHAGEHAAIVDEGVWQRTQALLARNGRGARKTLQTGKAGMPTYERGRIPRISRLMALSIRFDGLIRDGVVADYAELARLGHVTRARITQIMNLLLLAPDIQEAILFLPRVQHGRDPIRLGRLQEIALTPDWRKQRRMWAALQSESSA